MRRRDFIALVGASAAAWPLPVTAQQAAKVPRVVYFQVLEFQQEETQAFLQGLADRGYIEGKNIVLEFVLAPTAADLPASAAKIVASKPDVIVCPGGVSAVAAQSATSNIPIVFSGVWDPVGAGLVTTLSRPGGNITGNSSGGEEVSSKWVALLREIVPGIKRVGVLYLPASLPNVVNAGNLRDAAIAQGLEPVMIGFVEDQDFASQFERLVVAAGIQGALNVGGYYFNPNRDLLWELLVEAKIPAVAAQRFERGTHQFAGVIFYAANNVAVHRRAGEIVDVILKGVKPADIPVQRPTVFDFEVDLKAAQTIGITIPSSILAQATLVIE